MSTKRQDPSVISPPCVFSQAANSSKTAQALLADGNDTVCMEFFFDWAALTVWFSEEKKTVWRHSVPMKNLLEKFSFLSAKMF